MYVYTYKMSMYVAMCILLREASRRMNVCMYVSFICALLHEASREDEPVAEQGEGNHMVWSPHHM